MGINKKEKRTMKKTFLVMAMRNAATRIPLGLGFALTVTCLQLDTTAQEVNLGTANNFAILAASAITDTGPSVINGGNVGIYPNNLSSITAFPPGTLTPPYVIHAADGAAQTAQSDLTTAYNQAAGLAPTATLTGDVLGTVGTLLHPLTPGVYFFASSAQLTGTLYLNDEGLNDPVFVFQIGSTLTTASGSSVVELNQGANTIPGTSIFWQVGSSATLGTTTAFDGNILAYTSITMNTGATDLDGRLLAMGGGGVGGAVTLDDNTITAPPAEVPTTGGGGSAPDTGSTLLLLYAGLSALCAFGRRFSSRL
jgi:hypothetical protein